MVATLHDHLRGWAGGDAERADVAAAIDAVAGAAARLAEVIGLGALAGALGAVVGDEGGGDAQKELDVRANELFLEALRAAPVAAFGSEENAEPIDLQPGAPLAVAIDPLDGSSNIDTNVPIGTIFAILPMPSPGDAASAFAQPGTCQLAAGFVIYGPQTALVLTVGAGTDIFTLDRRNGRFMLTERGVQIPKGKQEYAINASNYRHWDEPIRSYIDDCIAGAAGPGGSDFNMRWIASMVAEAFRVLARGGIFLYPRDARPGYEHGRLRLVYEANPIALLMEQAGGAATNGQDRILDLQPRTLHQRVPLVFGARDMVQRVADFCTGRLSVGERSPLFGRRGLFRT